jgi:hypothetical protein
VALAAGYMWMRNRPADRGLAILFVAIALMQLVEFVLWLVVDKCDDANRTAAMLVPLALGIQPLIATWAAWQYKLGWLGGYKQFFFLLVALTPITLWDTFRHRTDDCVVLENGHLAWPPYTYNKRFDSWILSFFYWIGLLYVITTLKNVPLAILLTAAYSWTYYKSHLAGNAWPSVYCHSVNALVVLAILLN